jgi:hypothetical protein
MELNANFGMSKFQPLLKACPLKPAEFPLQPLAFRAYHISAREK